MKEELIGFDDWKWERQKSSKLLYTLLKSIEKEVNEPALVTYLKVMNEKCGNDLILTEMITLKFREYIVPIIYLGIFHFDRNVVCYLSCALLNSHLVDVSSL